MRRIAEMAKSQNETGTDEPKRNIRFFVGGMHFSSAFLHRRRRKIEKIFVKKRREFYGLGEKHCKGKKGCRMDTRKTGRTDVGGETNCFQMGSRSDTAYRAGVGTAGKTAWNRLQQPAGGGETTGNQSNGNRLCCGLDEMLPDMDNLSARNGLCGICRPICGNDGGSAENIWIFC